ncbi:MAG: hypothetical protein JO336_20675 [Acidobacteriia bacterium]|nr:hypothetical protein [Terriglobia bacterium]MBV8904624.1 hypothetical protein [Terriglobia bacterium]
MEQGGNLEVTSKREGDPNQQKYVYPAKGGPVTFIEGGPPANLNISEVRTRISDYVIDETVKRNGKVVSTGRYTLDKQAKVLTLRGQGTDVQGKPYEYVGVYERR